MKKSKIQHDVITYRNLDIPLYDEFEVNDLVTEGQFISTSVTQGAALNKSYKILIYVPKGSKGAYIERISRYPKQRELLLDKDTIFRVVSKKERKRNRIAGDRMKMKSKEKKAYKDFQDRVAMLGKPRKLTEEEIKKLKKEGRI